MKLDIFSGENSFDDFFLPSMKDERPLNSMMLEIFLSCSDMTLLVHYQIRGQLIKKG